MALKVFLVAALAVLVIMGFAGCSGTSGLPLVGQNNAVNLTPDPCDESNRDVQYIFPPHCGDTVIKRLYAGQTIHVGWVAVWNDGVNIYVHYRTMGGWFMDETHLAVEPTLSDIPHTPTGNPKVGQFPYSDDHVPAVQDFEIVIPIDGFFPGQELFIAAHAAVHLEENGGIIQQETAWGDGCPGSNSNPGGGNWATFFTFNVGDCD